MAVSRESLYTLAEFQEHISLPENAGRLFELINGEIVEVSPGRTRNSELPLIIAAIVRQFCKENNLPCHMSGSDGAYDIQANVLVPDFAYKPTPMSDDYPDPVPPVWAVEIISPTDKAPEIRAKRQIYLRAAILYWEIYPKSQSIDVYVPGQPVRSVGINDMLDVAQIIPGFTLSLNELFSD